MIRRLLRVLVFVSSIIAVSLFALAAWQTIQQPSPAVPLEQTLVDQANGISRYELVSSDPSAPGAPVPMPGLGFLTAFLLSDAMAKVRDLRIIVFAISLAVSLLVLTIVRLETDSWTLALAATGFSLLGLGLLGPPPGLARPEPFLLFLALLGFLVLRHTHGVWGALVGAVPLGVAVFVHVEAGWFLLAAWIALALEGQRRLLPFAAVILLLVGGGYIWLSRLYGPWFNYAAWDVGIQSVQFSMEGALQFTVDHVIGMLGVCTVVAALSYAMSTKPWYGKKGIWMCFGIAAVTGELLATQSAHADSNAMFATVVAASLLGALSLQRIVSHLSASFDIVEVEGQSALLSILLLQFVVLLSSVRTEPWATGAVAALGIGQ